MTARRTVRERIDPRLTAALFANYRTPVDAVLELVDNAVDSRVAGRTLEVDLAVHPGRLVMEIIGGTGMGPGAIERDYLRWGASSKRSGDRIGRYGQGGKAAIGHLGNRFEIVASAAGDEVAYGFEDPAYRDRARLRTYDLRARKKVVLAALGYVRIEIGEVDRKLDPRRMAERLAEAYRPMLEAGEVRMVVNRARSRPVPGASRIGTSSSCGLPVGLSGAGGACCPRCRSPVRRRPAFASTTSAGSSGRRSGSGIRRRPPTQPSTAWSARWSCRTSR